MHNQELPGKCWIEVEILAILVLFLILGESVQYFIIMYDIICGGFL